jgi:hypothetical protein
MNKLPSVKIAGEKKEISVNRDSIGLMIRAIISVIGEPPSDVAH